MPNDKNDLPPHIKHLQASLVEATAVALLVTIGALAWALYG